jgi:hypothetical protein
MANTFYSDNYTLNQDGRTRAAKTATNLRNGEMVWVRAKVLCTGSGRTLSDVAKLGPIAAGVRPVYGLITSDAANSGLTCALGYTSATTAIATGQTWIASATSTLLTPAQIAAVSTLSAAGDELVLTFGGTIGTTDVNVTVLMGFVNFGA